MNKVITFLISIITLFSCTKTTDNSETTTSADSLEVESSQESSLYAQVDSTFNINGKTFRVNVKQYDLTDAATAKGDTLSRPTYTCSVRIFDAGGKAVLKDSVLRDSWGYEGKIVSIDAYELNLPQLSYKDNEIILAFFITERTDGDAIEGSIAFDTNKLIARYFFNEAMVEE